MTVKGLEKLYLETEHGTFTPIYTFDDFVFNEELQEYEYIGLVIHKTAQEVYDEWLTNKDKPVEPTPSTDDKIIVLENELQAVKEQNEILNGAVSELTMIVAMGAM